jgi:hypothetical protein
MQAGGRGGLPVKTGHILQKFSHFHIRSFRIDLSGTAKQGKD